MKFETSGPRPITSATPIEVITIFSYVNVEELQWNAEPFNIQNCTIRKISYLALRAEEVGTELYYATSRVFYKY